MALIAYEYTGNRTGAEDDIPHDMRSFGGDSQNDILGSNGYYNKNQFDTNEKNNNTDNFHKYIVTMNVDQMKVLIDKYIKNTS